MRQAEAEAEYRRAVELNPNDSRVQLGLANWLLSEGRTEEAVASSRRARELDCIVREVLDQLQHSEDS